MVFSKFRLKFTMAYYDKCLYLNNHLQFDHFALFSLFSRLSGCRSNLFEIVFLDIYPLDVIFRCMITFCNY